MGFKVGFWLCVLFGVGVLLNIQSFNVFGVPYGMSDVDRYVDWVNNMPIDYRGHVTHWVILGLLELFGFTYFIPFVCLVLLPFFVYMLCGYSRDSVWLFVLGSYVPFYVFVSGLWSQALSMCFLVYGFFWVKRDSRNLLGYGLVLLGCVVHPYMLGVFVLYTLSQLIYNRKYLYVVIGSTLGVSIGLHYKLYTYLVFFSDYGIPEPTLYIQFFVYTCPLIWLLGLKEINFNTSWGTFALTMIITGPFIHMGRYFLITVIVWMPYIIQGYQKQPNKNKILIILFCILWFQYFFYFINQNYCLELGYRALDCQNLPKLYGLSDPNYFY